MKLSELFVSFVDFPLLLVSSGDLDNVLGVWLLSVFRLLDNVLANRNVKGLLLVSQGFGPWGVVLLLLEGGAMLDVLSERRRRDKLGTWWTFHRGAVFQYFLHIFESWVLFFQNPVLFLNFFEGVRHVLVGLDELLSSLLFVTGDGFLEGYEQSIMKLFVFHHSVFKKSNLVFKVALFK